MSQDETPKSVESEVLENTEATTDTVDEQTVLQAEAEIAEDVEQVDSEVEGTEVTDTEEQLADSDDAVEAVAEDADHEELLAESVDEEFSDDGSPEALESEDTESEAACEAVQEDDMQEDVEQESEIDAALLPSELHVSLIESLHEQLKASYDNAVDNQIILDCSEVEDVDSACIQLLTAFQLKAKANEMAIDWRSVPKEMQSITENLGLDAVLAYESCAGQAVADEGGSGVSGDDLLMF